MDIITIILYVWLRLHIFSFFRITRTRVIRGLSEHLIVRVMSSSISPAIVVVLSIFLENQGLMVKYTYSRARWAEVFWLVAGFVSCMMWTQSILNTSTKSV